jgi:hypothetical protein
VAELAFALGAFRALHTAIEASAGPVQRRGSAEKRPA